MSNYFIKSPISPSFVSEELLALQSEINIGAHNFFLGQIRADHINGKEVTAIDYTAYEEMANKQFDTIRSMAIKKFNLSHAAIYHSLGVVKTGEICLFVLASAKHRKEVLLAIEYMVELIKKEVPIFGKEMFEDSSFQWKENFF